MRAKLKILSMEGLAKALWLALLISATGCKESAKDKGLVLGLTAILPPDSDYPATHGLTVLKKHEVKGRESRLIFFEAAPYRGISVLTVYCYEELGEAGLYFRGLVPVWLTAEDREITYLETTNGVAIRLGDKAVSTFEFLQYKPMTRLGP